MRCLRGRIGVLPAAVLSLILITSILFTTTALTVPYAYGLKDFEPQPYVYGTCVKDIVFGESIWRWEDEKGVDHVLPYTVRKDENITLDAWYVAFTPQMANESFSFTGSASDEWAKKLDDHGLNYWYIRNVLDDQSKSGEWATLSAEVSVPVTETTHVLVCMKLVSIGSPASDAELFADIYMSSGGNGYMVRIGLSTLVAGITTSFVHGAEVDYVVIKYPAQAGDAIIAQFPLEDVFNRISGMSIDMDSTTKITLSVIVHNDGDSTTTGESAEAYFRFCIITEGPVYVNGRDYVLNSTSGTTIQLPASEKLELYGADATGAHRVTIPFIWYLTPERNGNPDTYEVDYTYDFKLPSQAVESYSGLTLNLTLNRDASTIEKLYLNGEDLLPTVMDKTGTVTLKSNLTPDTDYTLLMRVRYTADEYIEIFKAEAGFLYYITHPIALFCYIIGVILVALGFKAKGKKFQAKALPRRR